MQNQSSSGPVGLIRDAQHSSIKASETATLFILIILTASLISHKLGHLKYCHSTSVALLVGIAAGGLAVLAVHIFNTENEEHFIRSLIEFREDLFLNVLLPVIIFFSGQWAALCTYCSQLQC
jgi:hypothetical protein